MWLTRLAVNRPVTTFMGCLIVMLLGAVSLRRLAIDLMPDITFPTVSVVTLYQGAAPAEVETLLTRKLEQALSSVNGVDRLSSTSTEGASTIRVQLSWGSDIDAAVNDMRQSIAKIRHLLPEGIEEPYIRKYDVADSPIIYLGLLSELPPIELTQLTETQISPRLERIRGVARVRLRGAVRREIQVDLNRRALEARNISIYEVVEALQADSEVRRTGDLEQGHFNLLVRSRGEFENVEQVAETVVRQQAGAMIRVGDIAEVVDGHERRTELTRTNGQPGMMIYIYRQAGANTVKVARAVREAVKELNTQLHQADLTVRVDKSEFILQSIANVRLSALLGMSLAVLVLIFFLRSFRSTLVIAISMPLSVLATFVLIYYKGFTLNLVSFGGLALGVGLLVDNSIVVMESIFRKRSEGLDPKTAAIEGTREVASAIIASTITTLIVFLPLMFIEGISGVLLHQLAWVVSMSLICSLFASLTLTPVLTTAWNDSPHEPNEANARRRRGVQGLIDRFHDANAALLEVVERAYEYVLQKSMRFQGGIAFVLLICFACTAGLTPLIGTEFLPKTDEGDLRVETEMAAGIQLASLDQQARKVEQAIEEGVPERVVTAAFIGDDADEGEDWNRAWFHVRLPPRSQRERGIEEIRSGLEKRIGPVPGMKVRVQARSDLMMIRVFRSRRGGGALAVEIRGHDLKESEALADSVQEMMKQTAGLINVQVEKEQKRPVLFAEVDRPKAGMLGISSGDVTQAIETTIRGSEAAVYRDAGDEFNVLVRLRQEDRDRQTDVGRVGVATPLGRIIPLKSLVNLKHQTAAMAIQRLDQQRVIIVSADVEDRDLGSAAAELRQQLNALSLPPGFSINIGGDVEEQQKSFESLKWGFVLALLLMYMVMASQFESLRDPLLILITVPLGAIGVILVLVLTNTTLNVQSFIGIIMLSGIVVNNAIVLVDYINQLRRTDSSHGDTDQLIIRASARRFRPILMTTITTVLAMTPIALGWGEAGELQAPLARVVVGGLLSAMLTTLIAIPLAYRAVVRARES